jgi:transcriptional regulator with XRE-family HTH domain
MRQAPVSTKPSNKRGGKTELSVQVGRAARDARLKLGLTQADVAERVGITGEVYGRVERGEMMPSTPKLKLICGVLRVPADRLIGLVTTRAEPGSPATPPDDTPLELRRLIRLVRTMDEDQLAVFMGTASGLLKLKGRRRRQGKHDKSQQAGT